MADGWAVPAGAGVLPGVAFGAGDWPPSLAFGPLGPFVPWWAAFQAFQPGCFEPTSFGPPAQGGRPGWRTAVPSIDRTSISLELPSTSPVTSWTPPAFEASGLFAPHHHGGPTSSW